MYLINFETAVFSTFGTFFFLNSVVFVAGGAKSLVIAKDRKSSCSI